MNDDISKGFICNASCANLAAGTGAYALTALQQAMVAGELSPDRWQRDVVQIRCDLTEALDITILRQVLRELIQRHESLRAVLNWNDEGGQQTVSDSAEITLQVIDVEKLAPKEQEQRIGHHLQTVWTEPFDVVQPPRIRASLIRFSAVRYQFMITYQETELDEHAGKLLMQEILELYDNAAGKAANRFSNPISFRHYLTWLSSHRDTEACHFWGELLASAPSPTTPPLIGTGYVDGNMDHCLGNIIETLPQEATDRLKTWAAKHNATLNTVLLAAWSRLLAEHARQDDVRFSAVFSLRDPSYQHAQTAVAMCFSVLPFITTNARICSADELLISVRDHEAASRKHSMFLDGSPATRRQLGHPSTQSLIFFDDCGVDEFLHQRHPEWDQRKFSLFGRNPYAIAMRGFGGKQMRIQTWYNPKSYDHRVVRCLLDQLVRILELLPTRQDRPIVSSDFVTEEHTRLLRQWECGPVQKYRSSLLHDLIHEKAIQSPDAAAIIGHDKTLTFKFLDEQSTQMAHLLTAQGATHGQTVAVCMNRTPELIVSLLSILKAGSAYVPIDASWPAERIAGILKRLRTQIIITDSSRIQHIQTTLASANTAHTVIQWDGDKPQDWPANITWLSAQNIEFRSVSNVSSTVTPDDIAYIIFTSGSTGEPKGVSVSHSAVCNLIDWAKRTYHFDSCDCALWVTSPGFDLSVFDIFGLLACGGSIRIATENDLASPERLLEILTTEPITFWNSAPQALDRLAKWLAQKPLSSQVETSHLRLVFLSGDWIPLQLPDMIRQYFANAQVISLGGATEATVWSNVYPVNQIETGWRSIPYGRPIQNARYYVLNDQRGRCGIGVPGELYIAGDVLATGYAADPKQTDERFVPDVHASENSGYAAKMYRTGDLARWWPDGTMEILGRVDHQVKVRGYRIELGEIEQALRTHPDIQEAVVIAKRNERHENQLIAHLVGSTVSAIKYDSLHHHLRRILPDYMIPASFVILDGLPMTANGKIDRRVLERTSSCSHSLRQREYVPAQSPREQILAAIFQRVLRIDRAGADDNFIELGGDSLSALEVIFTAEQAEIYFTMDQLREKDLKTLAAQHQEKPASKSMTTSFVDLPLIPNQRWLLERSFDRPASYGFMAWLKSNSRIDHSILTQAWQQVMDHHEALRTRFTYDGSLHQHLVPPGAPAVVTEINLRRCDPKILDQQIQKIGLNATQQATLLNSILPSLTCVPMPGNRDLIFVYIPHIITDEYSARIVIDDLATAYTTIENGGITKLPSVTTSLSQWTRVLSDLSASARLQREYENLCALPWNKVKPLSNVSRTMENTYSQAKDVRLTLSLTDTQCLLEAVRRSQVPLESLLVTALGHVLGTWAEAEYLLVDITGAGREQIRHDLPLHRSVGYFSTIHPVLIPCSRIPQDQAAVRNMDQVLQNAPGRGIWYGLMRYGAPDAAMHRHIADLPQAQIKFNYHGLQPLCSESSIFEQTNIALPHALKPTDKRQYLLNLEVYFHQGCLCTSWKYASHIHHESVIVGIASRYLESLRQYANDSVIMVSGSTQNMAQATKKQVRTVGVIRG